MFLMTMPETFAVGDTAPVRINGEPVTLTWRDATTLVINGTDVRTILMRRPDGGGLVDFICADDDAPARPLREESGPGWSIVVDDGPMRPMREEETR